MKVTNKSAMSAASELLSAQCLFTLYSHATGMVPETSVVIVEGGNGEATMYVTSTDNYPMLLTTTFQEIAQDNEKLLLVSPPPSEWMAAKRRRCALC